MKVISRQRNSRMCIICGLDNPWGVKAPFYNMADGSVITRFKFQEPHQGYPERVHGGMITAMIDELGLRGLWSHTLDDNQFGVTISLESKFRKAVPYNVELRGRGELLELTSRIFAVAGSIYDDAGTLLANGVVKYIKLAVPEIASGVQQHEELCYLIDDGVTELD